MNLFRLRTGETRQLWWLTWLLPYLFFSVAVDGLHNHPLLPGGPSNAHHRVQTARSAAPGIKATHTDQDDDNCIACQWNSMASAMVSLCAVLTLPSHFSADISTAGISAASVNTFIRAGRGPPSL